ncbi:PREDICTED: 50S ribosomal protein 5 alpha, chloroplastic-like [Ipomoea nil]|uniref:50S ribosomal protein 5 alpha, chloroplastic-like n=1 Tax=Ipomoea nil TaxID=35883 RepID=UPI000900C644|nr:PREDICTED: 50S ribosomal protein 5 alpha, chloroplastic-like [Ipomoea nil]
MIGLLRNSQSCEINIKTGSCCLMCMTSRLCLLPSIVQNFKSRTVEKLNISRREEKRREEMKAAGLISFTATTIAIPHASHSLSSNSLSPHHFSRLVKTSNVLPLKSYTNYWICAPYGFKERGVLIANAASDAADGMDTDNPEPPSEGEEESLPFENDTLEPKLQLKLEQKMRMKVAKKISLRRKKLDRKRRLRKKGRWPPSKLKKNKNV